MKFYVEVLELIVNTIIIFISYSALVIALSQTVRMFDLQKILFLPERLLLLYIASFIGIGVSSYYFRIFFADKKR
jgi:hypothetical protein